MRIFERLDHVSIGVGDLEKATRLFIEVLGGEPMGDAGTNENEGFRWTTFRLGGRKVELVAPYGTGPSGVGRYIEKHGEGFHHCSISVANLEAAVSYFKSKGIGVLGLNVENPHWKHCYLNPKDTFGALVQVFEENEQTLSHAE
jgi:methylmalonyl-CoA/ethylmalonyl-CoA epimerase